MLWKDVTVMMGRMSASGSHELLTSFAGIRSLTLCGRVAVAMSKRGEGSRTHHRGHFYAATTGRLGYGEHNRARALAADAGETCALAQMGPILERAAVGDGAGRLQRQRRRLELLHPRSGALPRLP